jgi:hypothetical protein
MTNSTDTLNRPTRTLASSAAALALAALGSASSAQVVLSEDFEGGWGTTYATNGVWQVGSPTSGPMNAYSGIAVAGTSLAGAYPADTDSCLRGFFAVLPSIAADEEIRLQFMNAFEYGGCDSGYVQLSTYDAGDGSWSAFETVGTSVVNNSGWSLKEVDLSAYAGQTVEVAFCHTAASAYPCGSGGTGWYIDDVLIEVRQPSFNGDFENGWNGWSTDRGVWQVGTPQAGPGAAFGGTGAVGTHLDGSYPPDTDSRLVSPTVSLPHADGDEEVHLRFRQWFSNGGCDTGYIQISSYDDLLGEWSAWATVGTSIADSSSWSPGGVDVTAFAGQKVRFAFYHTAASAYPCGSGGTGWYIDDVTIDKEFPTFTGDFENGESGWSAGRGVWQIGEPTSGPGSAFNGLGVAATVLGGNYPADTDSRLVSPSIRLPCEAGPFGIQLRFMQWFSFGGCESGSVQVSAYDKDLASWSAWETVGNSYVNSSPWSLASIDLSSYAGQVIRIGFVINASSAYPCGSAGAGWYIDDITLPGSPFRDLGGSTLGVGGRPCLEMCGDLTPGSTLSLELTDAAPDQCTYLFLSLGAQPVSILGGTLHAFPFDDLVLVHTDAAGAFQASTAFPDLPAGTEVTIQAVVVDPTSFPYGHALSNGVVGTVP